MHAVQIGLMTTPPLKMSVHFVVHQSDGTTGGRSPAGGAMSEGWGVGSGGEDGMGVGVARGSGVTPGASVASGKALGGSSGGFAGVVPPGKAQAVYAEPPPKASAAASTTSAGHQAPL